MKLGIMQPYFFPYLGYWQLIKAVDKYVIYDDVNFIKGGWINRNRILVNGEAKYINLQMVNSSSFKKINEISINTDTRVIDKNIRMLEYVYKNAPFFDETIDFVSSILKYPSDNLADYLANSIIQICRRLGIETTIYRSSEINKNNNLKGQDKVIQICKILQADAYYNAIGGMELYSFDDFNANKIKLHFLKTDHIEYKQFEKTFVDSLSIIDVLMFNSPEVIKEYLEKYTIIRENNS